MSIEASKQEKIVSMFDAIAPTYDLANRILSFGIDQQWRRTACELMLALYEKETIDSIADIACGTGDMLIAWKEQLDEEEFFAKEFIGVDPSGAMLELAITKVPFASFKQAKAQQIPLENGKTDMLSISYGFRNVVEKEEAVKEFFRVLKPNGLIAIVEFTKNESKNPLNLMAHFYVRKILPFLGGMVSGNYEAYRYLPDSISDFYTKRQIEALLTSNGFKIEKSKTFSFGISTLIIGRKIV